MAKRQSSFAITFHTGGRRAEQQSKLGSRVGSILKRDDEARKRAASSTNRKAKTITSQAVRTTYSVNASQLAGKIRASQTPETIRIFASRRRFYLSEFPHSWSGRGSKGAQASIIVGRRKTYDGSFMAPGRISEKRTELIYARSAERKIQTYGRYKGKYRQAVIALKGPSTFEMIVDPIVGSIKNTAIRVLSDYYVSEYRRQFRMKTNG